MKELKTYISEAFKINKNTKLEKHYKYLPETKKELEEIINERIKIEGNNCNLNDIDTIKITDMSGLFKNSIFNGDISNWDVSNVDDMNAMFYQSEFNQNISKWDVSNVEDMSFMFSNSQFNQDISGWDVSNVTNNTHTFTQCPIEEKYKPKFK